MKKMWYFVFLIGLICILLLRYRDYYHFETDDGGYLTEYENSEKEEYKGMISSVGDIHLKRGDYYIQIDSSSQSSNNYFEIVDTAYSDGVEISERILYSAAFEKGSSQNRYEFSLKEDAENLCIRSYQSDGKLRVSGYCLNSIKPYYSDTWFLALIWIVLWVLIIWKYQWFLSENARPYLIIFAVGLAISAPLFTDFLSQGHDILFHLQRLNGLTESLIQGDQFPVRVNLAFNNGYGQLTSIMYPELFLYIPAILGMLGVSLLISVKFLLIMVNIATGLIGYYSMKTVAEKRIALFFSIVYMLSPYRLNDLYIRFALGEYLAMTFLPLLFIGIYHIVCKDYKKWWMAAAGCCGVLQSHLLTTEMSVIFALGFAVLNIRFLTDRKRIGGALKAVCVSLILNLWYLIPLFQFMGFRFSVADTPLDLAESGTYIAQMFSMQYSPYGDKMIGSTYQDMTLTVGVTLLIGSVIYLLFRNKIMNRYSDVVKLFHSSLILGILATYMASWLFPWQLVYQNGLFEKIFGMIQFSWRFLIFTTFFLSIITAFVMDWCWDEKQNLLYIMGFCMICSVLTLENGYIYENQSIMVNKFDHAYEKYEYSGYYKKDYGTEIPMSRGNIVSLDKDAGLVTENYKREGSRLSFDFEFTDKKREDREYVMTFPYYNYGFYEVKLDDKKIETFSDAQELVAVRIPSDIKKGHMELKYEERRLYILCNVISLAGMVILAGKKSKLAIGKLLMKKKT